MANTDNMSTPELAEYFGITEQQVDHILSRFERINWPIVVAYLTYFKPPPPITYSIS